MGLECADAPADLSPESSLCIHEMSFFGLFYKKVSGAAGWEKERVLHTAKFNYDNLIISADHQDDPRNHIGGFIVTYFRFFK